MLNFLFIFLFILILHVIKIYYYFNKFTFFMINNIFLTFLHHLLKQLLNNIIFISLIIFLTFKCFINFLKYTIIII